MIYHTGSRLIRRFVHSDPTLYAQDQDSLDMWAQSQALLAGKVHSVLSGRSNAEAGLFCAYCRKDECAFCGRELVKPFDTDPLVRAFMGKFFQSRSWLCTQCESVRYCSKGCQHQDWKFHKTHCKASAAPGSTGTVCYIASLIGK